MRIVLYTRPGCHLCEEVEDWLVEAGVVWQSVDITVTPPLYELYRYRIPVIECDGREVLAAPITRAELRRAVLGDRCSLSTARAG
jgi:glutaredoxin